jgi:predicted RNA-binding protein with PUA-like domain
MPDERRYWLVKTEPDCFSIDDLARQPKRTTGWEGVRNYQARNLIRDEMKRGELVLFYHSSCQPPGVAGVAKIVRAAYPDVTALDRKSQYYDAKATADDPRWFTFDLQLEKKFDRLIPLEELKSLKGLDGMVLLQRGSRLSVQPVTKRQFETIVRHAGEK